MSESVQAEIFADLAENRANLLQTYTAYAHARQSDLEGETMLLEQDQSAYGESLQQSLIDVPIEVYQAVVVKEQQQRWDAIISPDSKGQSFKQLLGKFILGCIGAVPASVYLTEMYGQLSAVNIAYQSVALGTSAYLAAKKQPIEVIESQKSIKTDSLNNTSHFSIGNQLELEKFAVKTVNESYGHYQKIRKSLFKNILIISGSVQYVAYVISKKI